MAAAPEPHPSAKELSDFGLGRLPRPASDTVAAHLERCTDCVERLSEQQPDSFMGRLRAASPTGGTALPGDGAAPPGPRKASPPPDFPPELAALEKFEHVKKIGEGGMGAVWKARHVLLDKDVAVKVMNNATLGNAEARDRFFTEMRAGGRLDHPNIARVIDAGRAGELLFLVMEFVEGLSLDRYVGRKGRMATSLACDLVAQAALGLQHAHEKGMAHRDIKPANLVVTRDAKVKLLDFGLVRLEEEGKSRKTRFQEFMGTAHYVAPEQATNARGADIRSDIYSLGCTLYFLLAGKPPFEGETVIDVAAKHVMETPAPLPHVPAGLWAVIEKMMAKRRENRYQTPKEVVEALRPFGAVTPASAEGGSPPPLPPSPIGAPVSNRPGKRLAVPVLVAVALLVPLGIWLAVVVLRLETAHGVLVVEIKDDEVEARIKNGKLILTGADGKDRYTLTPAERRKDLPAGPWKIRVEGADGLTLDTSEFTLQKRGEVTVRVTLDRKVPIPQTTDQEKGATAKEAAKPVPSAAVPAPATDLRRAYRNRCGRWKVEGDELVQETRTYDCELAFGDFTWTDYDFSCEVMKTSGIADIGLMYHLTGAGRSTFNLGGWTNTLHFATWRGPGSNQQICQLKGAIERNRWYKLRVKIRGTSRECFLDEQSVFRYEDAISSKGAVGLRTFATSARFRNLRVTDPEGKPLFEGLPSLPASAGQWFPATVPASAGQLHRLEGHGAPVTGVAFTRDGRSILTCSNGETSHVPVDDGKAFFFVSPASTVLLWDRESGKRLDSSPILEPVWDNRAFTKLALAPAGDGFLVTRRIASQSVSANVHLATAEGGKILPRTVFRDENRNITALAFTPDGRKARALGLEGGFWEWDLADKKLVRQWPGGFKNVSCGALAPDGRFALLGRRDQPFAEIDLETGKETGLWKEKSNHPVSLAISADGARILEGTARGEPRLWDVSGRRVVHTFVGHQKPVRAVAFSPDGRRALTGGDDKTVCLWDLEGKKQLARFTGHTGRVLTVAFSHDGRQAASGSADYTVRVWRLP